MIEDADKKYALRISESMLFAHAGCADNFLAYFSPCDHYVSCHTHYLLVLVIKILSHR